MAGKRSPAGIGLRFCEEQPYFERYTRFLPAKSIIHDQVIAELSRILHGVGVKPLPTRKYDRKAEPCSAEELGAPLAAICDRNV